MLSFTDTDSDSDSYRDSTLIEPNFFLGVGTFSTKSPSKYESKSAISLIPFSGKLSFDAVGGAFGLFRVKELRSPDCFKALKASSKPSFVLNRFGIILAALFGSRLNNSENFLGEMTVSVPSGMKCFLDALKASLTVSLCLMFAMLRYEFLRLSIVSGMRVFATIFLYLLVVGPPPPI